MNVVLFVIGIWMGFCTFVAYCCVHVGSMHDDDYDDWYPSEEEVKR
jgi:hypothetical protein